MDATPTRPIVRWHGGKSRIAPWIISHLPPHRVYVEPFAGAASVLLRKARSHTEVLNDANGRLVSAFRVIRDRGEELAHLLRYTPCAEEEYRDCREVSPDPLEDARRMLVLGHQSHGSTGGCTGGKRSGWRRGLRPGGTDNAAEWRELWRHVERWADRLRGVYLENGDALDVIRRWDAPDVVIYADPPYTWGTRSGAGRGDAYGPHEMSDADHVALAEVLRNCRGAVVLSGYRSGLYDELFEGWQRVESTAWADGGVARTECLWLSPRAQSRGLFEDCA